MSKLVRFTAFIMAILVTVQTAVGQEKKTKPGDVPKGWHLLDKETDGFYGISLNKAYDFIKSKNLKGKTVIVAIIDSGIDTTHEDLKNVLWTNPKEIPGNGIDDDGNGYVDDVHGWNFLGGKDGQNVKQDSYEGTRVYHKYKDKFEGKDSTQWKGEDLDQYNMWHKAKEKMESDGSEVTPSELMFMRRALVSAKKSDSLLRHAMNKQEYTGNDLDTFSAVTSIEKAAKGSLLYLFKANQMMDVSNKEFIDGFDEYVTSEERKAEAKADAKDKAPKDYRGEITHDNEDDINDKYYGNNDIMAGTPFHGTHVAGIIGAERNNGKGIDGIADNVRIMMIRAVPDGDEHDKDIALAIRYAVDNGAKVVNMSFGKEFSPGKKWIDDAVKYAEGKGVLLVHAAGNDAKDVDSSDNYPNPTLRAQHETASNWITVGASGDPNAGGLTAVFSNYGKQGVDIFAPGVKIYSSIPGGNTYGNAQGTSMACPVVVGTAALLMEYFPYLTPQQIKYCIMKSAQVPGEKVKKPGTDQLVPMSDLAVAGGVINAYEAVKVAYSMDPNGHDEPKKKSPKPTMKNKKG